MVGHERRFSKGRCRLTRSIVAEMSQSKNRLARMQSEQPWCIYCGGATQGTSVDHMPPIAVFNSRYRLKGMEFLACDACHAGSRPLDQVAGLLCRAYPDPGTPQARAEMTKILGGIKNNFPVLLREMEASREQDELARGQTIFPDAGGALNIGAGVHAYISQFAARAGLALHYHLCREIVPPGGGVFVRWYTNTAIVNRELNQDFLELLGNPRTLKQGAKSLEDQFEYKSRATDDVAMSAHFMAFRLAFAAHTFVARDVSDLKPPPGIPEANRLFQPGFLKRPAGEP
jgi:hypothetical protein